MLRYVRIPLLYLFLGSLLGVFLRWQFIVPTPGIHYTFFLHAHSHIMFLGWIFNVLYIALCHHHIPETKSRFFHYLFIVLQVLVVGMLISFPLQGYGFYSILFSTLHTLCVIVFIVKFFRQTKDSTSVSVWFARIALLFFALSAAGPFSLGYLMSNGLGQSNLYYCSIYFYLHFQYNGFFLFGIFSLFFNLLERKEVSFDHSSARTFGWILAAACFPTYLLSILWAAPGMIVNIVAGIAAFIQFIALYILIELVIRNRSAIKKTINRSSVCFLLITLAAFALKLLLQASSAFPGIAQMAYELRPVVIAYLHLVLIGIISLSLLVWYIEFKLVNKISGQRTLCLFLLSFAGMEICLTISPWWSAVWGANFFRASECIFLFSVALSFSCFLLMLCPRDKPDENQSLD